MSKNRATTAPLSLSDFDDAVGYITQDIERELALARVRNGSDLSRRMARHGITGGGANVLAALGLLCYTEFAGWVMTGHGTGHSELNFKVGLGLFKHARQYEPHADDLYRVFRCGMAHTFYPKRPDVSIRMPGLDRGIGIRPSAIGALEFWVGSYWRDLRVALKTVRLRQFPVSKR